MTDTVPALDKMLNPGDLSFSDCVRVGVVSMESIRRSGGQEIDGVTIIDEKICENVLYIFQTQPMSNRKVLSL